jgi:hypothetical protein
MRAAAIFTPALLLLSHGCYGKSDPWEGVLLQEDFKVVDHKPGKHPNSACRRSNLGAKVGPGATVVQSFANLSRRADLSVSGFESTHTYKVDYFFEVGSHAHLLDDLAPDVMGFHGDGHAIHLSGAVAASVRPGSVFIGTEDGAWSRHPEAAHLMRGCRRGKCPHARFTLVQRYWETGPLAH